MKLIKLLVMISLIGGIMLLTGCAGFVNKEKVVKDALENKYGEEMLIYSVDVQGSKFYAKCAPASNPEVVFETKIFSDGTEEWDDYYRRYTAYLMNDTLKDDLKQFFPDAYVRSYIYSMQMIDTSMDFRDHSLSEILENSISEGPYGGLRSYVYINGEIGTAQNYAEEYRYFTEEIDKYINQNEMLPIIITFYWLDKATVTRVEDYFSRNTKIDTYYEEKILGASSYKRGVDNLNEEDVGNPPNIVTCFIKTAPGWIGSEEEYIRRRELIEKESLY